MPFAPTVTYVAGDPIDSVGRDTNQKGLQDYLNGGIIQADLDVSAPWVRTANLVRSYYNPLSKSHTFISGVSNGKVFSTGANTNLNISVSDALGVGDDVGAVEVPNTALEIELEDAALVLFQFRGQFAMYSDMYAPSTSVAWVDIYCDGVLVPSTTMYAQEERQPAATDTMTVRRHLMRSHYLVALSAGKHSIGLRGISENHTCPMFVWSVNIEGWYHTS